MPGELVRTIQQALAAVGILGLGYLILVAVSLILGWEYRPVYRSRREQVAPEFEPLTQVQAEIAEQYGFKIVDLQAPDNGSDQTIPSIPFTCAGDDTVPIPDTVLADWEMDDATKAAMHALRPLECRDLDQVRIPLSGDLEEAENVLIVARAYWRENAPLYIEDVMRMFDGSYCAAFYDSLYVCANEWMRWILGLAPDQWDSFIKAVPGQGTVIGEIVPVRDRNEVAA